MNPILVGCTAAACVLALTIGDTAQAGTFSQETAASYGTAEGLPSEDVHAVAADAEGRVFAGTSSGLATWTGTRWEAVEVYAGEPVWHVASDGGERILLVTGDGLHELGGKKLAPLPEGAGVGDVLSLAASGERVCLGARQGLMHLTEQGFAPDDGLARMLGEESSVHGVAFGAGNGMAVAAASGLYVREGKAGWRKAFPKAGDRSWAPVDVRGVCYDARGRLWFASPQGAGCFDGAWTLYAGADGLPYNDFTSVAAAKNGEVWFGTHIGAIRYDGTEWRYREGKRWLPDNDVRSVAIGANRDVWFATAGGVGRIERRPMTYAAKAKFFEDEIDKRHRRTPFWLRAVRGLAAAGG